MGPFRWILLEFYFCFGVWGPTRLPSPKPWSFEFLEARSDPVLNMVVQLLASEIHTYRVKCGSFPPEA